ncbi:hypothetical protein ABZ863_13645 [Saccharomonospora sp. NPDC046836]|uniref:hypothetical protein n=1 Tax=Saccharomonospora sp. NPDC046836 TaxID=3156921 RepID=UPI0033C62BA5
MTGRLTGQIAFITSAARGQGRARAVAMSHEGADIATVDMCRQIEGFPYSLATEDDLDETVGLAEGLDRHCLGVINHGIVLTAPWDTVTDKDFGTMIEVNLSLVWRAARAPIPHFVVRGGGALPTSQLPGIPPITATRIVNLEDAFDTQSGKDGR